MIFLKHIKIENNCNFRVIVTNIHSLCVFTCDLSYKLIFIFWLNVNSWLKITKLLSGRPRFQTEAAWLREPVLLDTILWRIKKKMVEKISGTKNIMWDHATRAIDNFLLASVLLLQWTTIVKLKILLEDT